MAAAAQPLRLSIFGGAAASGGQLVMVPGGGFMPARLLLAPAGARLPPGVHGVAAVPALALFVVARGSGSRAAHLLPLAAVPAPAGARLLLLAPGLHAVAAVHAPAVGVVAQGGLGSRAAVRLPPPAAVPTPGEPAPAADNKGAGDGAAVFYNFVDGY